MIWKWVLLSFHGIIISWRYFILHHLDWLWLFQLFVCHSHILCMLGAILHLQTQTLCNYVVYSYLTFRYLAFKIGYFVKKLHHSVCLLSVNAGFIFHTLHIKCLCFRPCFSDLTYQFWKTDSDIVTICKLPNNIYCNRSNEIFENI